MNKIINIFIYTVMIILSFSATAEEKQDQYLLSSESYKILTDVRELMDKKEYTTAESKLNNLLDRDIDNYERAVTYQTLGYIYISMDRYEDATSVFIKSISNNALPPDVTHEINYTIAQLLAQAGKYKDSLEYLNHWLEIEKSPDIDAHIFVASVYYQLQDYQKMIPHMQSAINNSTKPKKEWYEMLLYGYYKTNELKNAASLLEDMVKLYPDSNNYWLQLAATYYQIKKYNEALAVYKIAYTKNILSEDEILRLARLYLNAQLPYQAGKLLDETMSKAKISKSSENLKLLANSWSLARDYNRTVSTLLELAKLDDDPDTYFRLGQIYFRQEKWQDTVTMLKRAVKADELDNKAEAFLLLGIAAYHVDEKKQSEEALKRATGYKNTKEQAEWWLNKLGEKLEEKNS